MCTFKLSNPGLPAALWDAFDSDDDSDGPIEDERHAILDCPGYVYARHQFQDLFQRHITTVSQFLNQPQCNRLAKFLTWIRTCCKNKAQSDGSLPDPEQTLNQSIKTMTDIELKFPFLPYDHKLQMDILAHQQL